MALQMAWDSLSSLSKKKNPANSLGCRRQQNLHQFACTCIDFEYVTRYYSILQIVALRSGE
jgi:hypothetical protein